MNLDAIFSLFEQLVNRSLEADDRKVLETQIRQLRDESLDAVEVFLGDSVGNLFNKYTEYSARNLASYVKVLEAEGFNRADAIVLAISRSGNFEEIIARIVEYKLLK
mgnify:CR=1 FL=1